MRHLVRRLLLVALVIIALWLSHGYWEKRITTWWRVPAAIDNASTAFIYQLHSQQDLVIDLPPTRRLKIITNALLARKAIPQPGLAHAYSIHYSLRAGSRQIVNEKEYHLNGSLTAYSQVASQRHSWGSYIEGKQQPPLDSKTILVNFSGFPATPDRIHLRAGSLAPSLEAVCVRIYFERQTPESKADTQWRRLSNEQRRYLARGNIYPHELLANEEKRQLIVNRWEVLAPQGVPGRDFVRHILRSYPETDLRPVYTPDHWEQMGSNETYLRPGLEGVVAIPSGASTIRFQLRPVQPQTTPISTQPATFLWQSDQTDLPPRQWRENWRPGGIQSIQAIGPGWVTVTAPVEALLSCFHVGREGDDAIPDTGNWLRVTLCRGTETITFPVAHALGKPTPLRLDVRSIGNWPSATIMQTRYRLLDRAGKMCGGGTLTWNPVLNRSERSSDDRLRFSAKESFIFHLAPEVERLEISEPSQPILVSAFNRPPLDYKQTIIPDDLAAFASQQEPRRRDWFYLRPLRRKELEQQERWLALWIPPTAPTPAGADNMASVQDVASATPQRSRYVLTPALDPSQIAATLAPSLFSRLDTSGTSSLQFDSHPPLPQITPRLIIRLPNAAPQAISLWCDERLWWQGTLAIPSSELTLPAIPRRTHQIRVKGADNLELYINGTRSGRQVLRLAQILDETPIDLLFAKRLPRETLCLRLFTRQRQHAGKLEVELLTLPPRSSGPFADFTFRRRRYSLAATLGQPALVLHTPTSTIYMQQTLFFPLGQDLPAGEYRIRLQWHGDEAYLHAFRMQPGEAMPRWRIMRGNDDR